MPTTATIFDIKGFALNDGPGIRTTVFMKGCPLRCAWCHNPEGLSPKPEIYIKRVRCTHCGRCEEKCTHPDCQPYGRCLHVCPMGNISVAGKLWTSDELVERLCQDMDIFANDGGVTFSGGEPMLQHDFVRETAEKLLDKGIRSAIETSSYTTSDIYRRTLEPIDYIIADIKLYNREKHCKWCGVDNEKILENLRWLMDSGKKFMLRVPLIPEITDTDENLMAISAFIGENPVELLPYNTMAGAKYDSVGREYPLSEREKQDKEKQTHILSLFKNAKMK